MPKKLARSTLKTKTHQTVRRRAMARSAAKSSSSHGFRHFVGNLVTRYRKLSIHKKAALTLVAVALLSGILGEISVPFKLTHALPAVPVVPSTIAAVKSTGSADITARVVTLQDCMNDLQPANIPIAYRNYLDAQLQSEISGLNALKLKLSNDSNYTTAAGDFTSMSLNYRVDEMIVPKINVMIKAGDQLTSAANSLALLNNISPRITVDAKTTNFSDEQAELSKLLNENTSQHTAVVTLMQGMLPLTAVDYNKNANILTGPTSDLAQITANDTNIAVAGQALVSRVNAYTRPTYVVSLGGSIAAGLGLPGTSALTSTSDADCGRTTNGFPVMVAANTGLSLIQLACSDAKSSVGILQPQPLAHGSAAAQIKAAAPYLKGSVVTIFVGANDTDWIGDEDTCLSSGCPTAQTATFNADLQTLATNLKSVVQQVRTAGAQSILVNQYYGITTGDSSCLPHILTTSDIAWQAARLTALNATISSAASQNGATPVALNFSGHYVCSVDPWVKSVGQDAAMHPTLDGQKAIATADEAALRAH